MSETAPDSPTPDRVPEVSIVVPCYNGGPFLDHLLASLAGQTFRDFETIIVDDGSNEETRAKLAALDPSVIVIRQDNRGLSAARNTGFKRARAQLVLPLDCDDALEPDFLAETVAAMRQAAPDVGFAFTHERMMGARTGIMPIYLNPFEQLFTNSLTYCMLMRKAAWRAVGGYDESMRNGYEDWEFNIRLAHGGWRGIEIRKPLFIYTVSSNGMLMSRSSQLHGHLWSDIRRKHHNLYKPSALLKSWWCSRRCPGEITLWKALGLLMLASVLPQDWFSALIHRVRTGRAKAAAGTP
jgi:glycosyltransferase involved in cell wall biosynthesis